MTWNNKNCRSPLSRFLTGIYLLLVSASLAAQDYHLEADRLTSFQLIESVEEALDIEFNFNTEILRSQSRYTLSLGGSRAAVITQLSQLLDREIILLEDNLYVIQNQASRSGQIEVQYYQLDLRDVEGSALVGCYLEIAPLKLSYTSDETGMALIDGIFSPQTEISISYLGFEEKRVPISTLTQSGPNLIVLKEEEHMLGEVIIMDRRIVEDIQLINGKNVIGKGDIVAAGTVDNDAMVVSQMLPGVYNASESINDVQIRGGMPDQTSFEWNGIRLLQNSLFYGKISSINPFVTNQISVNKNGGQAKDGSHSAGVISMESDLSELDRTRIRAQADLLHYNLGVDLPVIKDKLHITTAYRRSLNDWFQSFYFDKFYNHSFQFGQIRQNEYFTELYEIEEFETIKQDFAFSDLSSSLSFRPHEKLRLDLSYLTVQNDFDYDRAFEWSDTSGRSELDISNWGLNGTLAMQWTEQLSTEVSFIKSQYNYQFRQGLGEDNKMVLNQRGQVNLTTQEQLRASAKWHSKQHSAEIGWERLDWDVLYQDGGLSEDGENEIYIDHDIESFEHSVFLDYQIQMPAVIVQWGLRFSDYSLSFDNRLMVEPRIHISTILGKNVTLHAHYGQYHQSLNRRTYRTNLEVEEGFWYVADEGQVTDNWINVVPIQQVSAGMRYKKSRWIWDVEAYAKNIQNIWSEVLDFTYEENPYVYIDSRVYGIELSGQYRHDRLSLTTTANIMSDKIINGRDLVLNSPFSQPLRLGLFANYDLGAVKLSAAWNYAKGRYYSEPTGLVEKINQNGETYLETEFDELLTAQGKDYHRLDLSLSYDKTIMNKIKSRVALSLVNVYDRNNIIRNQYRTDFTQDPVVTGFFQKQGLPFTPNISVYFEY